MEFLRAWVSVARAVVAFAPSIVEADQQIYVHAANIPRRWLAPTTPVVSVQCGAMRRTCFFPVATIRHSGACETKTEHTKTRL